MTKSELPIKTAPFGRPFIAFIFLGLILVIFVFLDLLTGTVKIPVAKIITMIFGSGSSNSVWHSIFYEFRIPKTASAILAGSALAVSGLQMQTVFRNPLAGPDVLGVTSGASLGVALIVMGFGDIFISEQMSFPGTWMQIIAAWAGAGLVLALIMIVSLRVGDIMTILILGILFGSATSSIVNVLQYFSQQSVLKTFIIWSMGNLGNLTAVQLKVLTISLIAGFAITFLTLKIMNAMLLGERYSRSMGINVKIARLLIFLSTSILAGSITAFCGPLAFIGIAVPHLARLIFKTANHYVLVPASMIVGSIIMLLADILSQLPGSGIVLPVNSVTAILGIPIVIWVIIYNRRFTRVGS
jgi:iron complex transport system permease protein